MWHERLTDRFDLRRRRSTRWAGGALALTALFVAAPVLVTSQASAAKKLTVADAAKKVEILRDQAEQATESYNAQREQLKSLDVRLAAAQDRLAAQQQQVAAARLCSGASWPRPTSRAKLEGLALFLSDDPDAALSRRESWRPSATGGPRRCSDCARRR